MDAGWTFDSVDGVVRNSRGYPVLTISSFTEKGNRDGRLAARAPAMLEALRKIAAQSCRPYYGSDGKKLDDVHAEACPACIAREAITQTLLYNPLR